MPYLTDEQLSALPFQYLGRNVKISDRAALHDVTRIAIGDNSRIDDFCVISGNVKIGRNVHIAVQCNVAGGEPGIVLEDFSGLAYGVQVFSQSDDYSGKSLTNPTVPDPYKKEIKRRVVIGRHCIVGTNSVILPGVTLAEGTAVGTLSLVRKSTQPWSVYFGSPAKRIGERSRDLLELEKQYLAETSSE
jgi:acetyltransferase-like isoleucine patch superfamily enzyme